MERKQDHLHTITKAMDRWECTSTSLNEHVRNAFDKISITHISTFIADQIHTLGPELQSPATLLFNQPIRCIMPAINSSLISADSDNDHYDSFVARQTKADRNYETLIGYISIPIRYTLAVQ